MRCALSAFLCFVLFLSCSAQTTPSKPSENPSASDKTVSFESDSAGTAPSGWGAVPLGTILVDGEVAHSGHLSVRFERKTDSPNTFSWMFKEIPMDLRGKLIELHGYMKLDNVSGFAALLLREDADGKPVAFHSLEGENPPKGTSDWAEYSISLPVQTGAQKLVVGVLVSGTGTAWVDDLQLTVDGKPVPGFSNGDRPNTAIESDHSFDGGSGIALTNLTETQIDNLATLGKVWGFLKYYHPQVTDGKLHWDYELLRVLPAILAAPDHASANLVLLKWIHGIGPVGLCNPCAKLDEVNLQLSPDLAWLHDETLLGQDLRKTLLSIQQNRLPGRQYYVSLFPGVGNPAFDHELAYQNIKFPDPGFQILALFRFWNIVEYWSPNRSIVGEDWNAVLRAFLPRIALAKTSEDYQRELIALIAMDHDTHANLWSSLKVRPPVGDCRLPLNLRFIGRSPVIYSFASTDAAATADFKVGDVLTALDGQPVNKLVEAWSPYYADSNQAARYRDIARNMTAGSCGPATVNLLRGTKSFTIKTQRTPAKEMKAISSTHDLPGDTFRMLSSDVAYVKLSSIKSGDIAHDLQLAANTKGLIIDIRNYPDEFVVFSLGSYLIDHPTDFVKFTSGDLSNPGAFRWAPPIQLQPAPPHYPGKIVIIVDETTQSQAEYTTMAFRSATQATVIGSTTAGADGNVSSIPLPGGLSSMISGLGVFYPGGKPTQQVGIIPDKTVIPTIEGIRAGRDEVLEEAIRQILGPNTPTEAIEQMIHPK
jgi:hypothetical protein